MKNQNFNMNQTRRIVLLLVLLILNLMMLVMIFKSSQPKIALWVFGIEALLAITFANKLYYFFFPNERKSISKSKDITKKD